LLSTFAYVFTCVLSVAAYLLRLVRGESTFAGRPLLAQTLGAALASPSASG